MIAIAMSNQIHSLLIMIISENPKSIPKLTLAGDNTDRRLPDRKS
jgi:hypothetical protein